MKIEYTEGSGYDIEVKRLYVPVRITDACPKCGQEVTTDLADQQYLSYPKLGKPEGVYFHHYTTDGDHEWEKSIVVELAVREA